MFHKPLCFVVKEIGPTKTAPLDVPNGMSHNADFTTWSASIHVILAQHLLDFDEE
jgi:hypothetical protein